MLKNAAKSWALATEIPEAEKPAVAFVPVSVNGEKATLSPDGTYGVCQLENSARFGFEKNCDRFRAAAPMDVKV
jgi:hypothetical protein